MCYLDTVYGIVYIYFSMFMFTLNSKISTSDTFPKTKHQLQNTATNNNSCVIITEGLGERVQRSSVSAQPSQQIHSLCCCEGKPGVKPANHAPSKTSVCTCTCARVHVCMEVHLFVCVFVCVGMSVCLCVCAPGLFLHVCSCVFACTCGCACLEGGFPSMGSCMVWDGREN